MPGRRAARGSTTRDQWWALIEAADATPAPSTPPRRGRRPAISRRRIVDAALMIISAEGYQRLTMRAVADALDTGPASLYQHVQDKSQLGDLLVGELCGRVQLPTPDPDRWRDQFLDVCAQLRDQFLGYPGLALAAMGALPADLASLRVGEALLTLLIIGGASPQQAAWTSDAAYLHVIAYALETSGSETPPGETSPGRRSEESIDRTEISARLRMLPADQFPHTVRYADQLTAGDHHERLDHALGLILDGLAGRPS